MPARSAQQSCSYARSNSWSLPPIFGGRTKIYMSKLFAYQSKTLGIKKIGATPIFCVLETQSQILGLCQKRENRPDINFLETQHPNLMHHTFI